MLLEDHCEDWPSTRETQNNIQITVFFGGKITQIRISVKNILLAISKIKVNKKTHCLMIEIGSRQIVSCHAEVFITSNNGNYSKRLVMRDLLSYLTSSAPQSGLKKYKVSTEIEAVKQHNQKTQSTHSHLSPVLLR